MPVYVPPIPHKLLPHLAAGSAGSATELMPIDGGKHEERHRAQQKDGTNAPPTAVVTMMVAVRECAAIWCR